jgi:hypothetical protein
VIKNLEHEEAKARHRAVKIQPQWVVTAGKQTYISDLNWAELSRENMKI